MNATSQLTELIHGVFERPERGVVGLVDDLLRLCPEQGLRLEWRGDRCRLSCPANGSEPAFDVPLSKSALRALLARVAVLCNKRVPNSVSPYGGRGELSAGDNTTAFFKVSFANTPSEQKLEVMAETEPAAGPNGRAGEGK